MKNFLKALSKYATLMAFGALAGMIVCLLVAPGILEWWATPDVPDKVCQCEKHVALATQRLVRIQMVGGIAFAVLTAIGAAITTQLLRARALRKAAAASSAPPPAKPGTPS